MNKIIKITFLFLFIIFLALYFSRYNSTLFENEVQLTNQAILQYEKDLKSGITIDSKNYLPPKKNYNNRASRLGVKASNLVDFLFRKLFSSFKQLISRY